MPTALLLTLALAQIPGAPPPPAPVAVEDLASTLAQEDFLVGAWGHTFRFRYGRGRAFKLLRMLGNPSFDVREEATLQLRLLGRDAVVPLYVGASARDGEVRARSEYLLRPYFCAHCRNRGACPAFRAALRRWYSPEGRGARPECPDCDTFYAWEPDDRGQVQHWWCKLCGRKAAVDPAIY